MRTGTLIGGYGGVMINRTVVVGLAGGVNLGHPTVNYGYFGGIGQVIAYPGRIVHMSGVNFNIGLRFVKPHKR